MIAYTNYSTDARVIKEAEALTSRGMSVDFICLKEDAYTKRNHNNGVKIFYVPLRRYRGNKKLFYVLSYLMFFLAVFFISTILFLKHRYEVIHVNNMPNFLVFAVIIPKLLGAKIILDIHDSLPQIFLTKFGVSNRDIFYRMILLEEKLSVKFVDNIITAHSLLKEVILLSDGLPIDKIETVYNYADETKFKLIDNYKINGKLRIVYHGTVAERFGLDNVLEILKDLNDIDFDFTIIGTGDYSEEIKNIIRQNNLESRVNFINKSFSVSELPQILADFNLGLVSYDLSQATEYMLPVKLLELISLGIPAIVVKNKVISHYFSEEDVFFYDSSESESLIQIIENISVNKNFLIEKRNRLLKIREKYFWSSEAEKYYDIVQNLIGEN